MTQVSTFYLSIVRKHLQFQGKTYYIPKDFILQNQNETTIYKLKTDLTQKKYILCGGFSIIMIYEAIYNSNMTIAVKIYCNNKKKKYKYKNHELSFYESIDYVNEPESKNICYFYGSKKEIYKKKYNYTYLFLEHLEYDLFEYIFKFYDFKHLFVNYKQHKNLLVIVANTLKYIHKKGFVYNDLKLENIMITNENKFKLIDFNCLIKNKIKDEESENKNKKDNNNECQLSTTGFVGTIDYLAPELFKICDDIIYYNDNNISFKNDYWTFGLFLYEVLTKQLFPYIHTGSRYETVQQIKLNLLDNKNYAYEFFKKLKFKFEIPQEEFKLILQVFSNCVKTCPKERKLLL